MPRTDKWSLKFDQCIKCGRNDLKHVSRGLCMRCYRLETDKRLRGKRSEIRGEAGKKLRPIYLSEEYEIKQRSLSDIAKENNCSRQFVYKKLLEYYIPLRNKQEARRLAYDRHKISYSIVDEAGEERIVTHKGYKINDRFFKNWSKEMAYVVGIIYTDGNLYHDPVKKQYRISIFQKHRGLLDKVLQLMNCDYILRYRKQRGIAGSVYAIDLQQGGMLHDLLELGLTANKSLNMIFPNVPTQYMRHYIRGCWDGDGSVYITGGRIDANYTTGSKIFIETLVQELYKIGIHKWGRGRSISDKSEVERLWLCYPDGKFPLTIHNKKGSNAFYIRLATKENVERLFHFLYDDVDESMYLKRKYDVFMKGLKLGGEAKKDQLTSDLSS
jgi:hypothetical protein